MSPEERALRTQADNTPGCYTHITVDVNVLRVVLDELEQQRARADAAEQDWFPGLMSWLRNPAGGA